MPGIYSGTFDGSVDLGAVSISNITGSVRAELVLGPSGDSLQILAGEIVGMNNTGDRATAVLKGGVNCATQLLESAHLEKGSWQSGSQFTGSLQGKYSANPHSVTGTWQVQSTDTPGGGGKGTWSMVLRGDTAR